MDIFSDKKIPVFSMDIETTTLDPFKSKTWSMGIAQRGKGKEYFNKGVVSPSSTDIVEDLFKAHETAGASLFGASQRSAGSFDGFAVAHASGALESIDTTMKNITSDLKRSAGVLLIQNTNFESSTLDWASSKSGDQHLKDSTKKDFVEGLFGTKSKSKVKSGFIFPEEADIKTARQEFNKALSKVKRSSEFSQDVIKDRGEKLKAATSSLERTITSVVSKNSAAGNMTVIDLMDISKIYTSKLYEGGAIKQPYVGTGLAVSFLAQELLEEKEAHTALSDADQQLRVFDKLNDRISSFNKTGILSEEDRLFGANLSNSDIHDRSFISALSSSLTEAQNKGKDLSTEEAITKELKRPLKDYKLIPENHINREAYVKDTVSNFLKSPEDTLENLHKHREAEVLTNYKTMTKDIASLANTSELLDLNPKKLSNSSKILLGLSAVGVVSALASSNRPQDEPLTSYNDLYENVYLGQSYADWKERNNSHKMIY